MVGYCTYRNIGVSALAVFLSGNFAYPVQNVAYRIDLKHIINVLHNACKTFKTHSGVDVFVLKLGICAVSHIIELRENVVPYFHIAVAVAARLAVGTAAAVFLAAVEINFAARSARTRSVLPEIVLLAETDNMLLGNAYFIAPYRVCLVVVLVNRRPKQIFRNFKNLG